MTEIKFNQPDFCHREKIEAIRLASENRIYTYSFPTIYSWAEDEQYSVYIEEDAFLVKNRARGENAYLAPCGTEEGKRKMVEALLKETSPEFYFLGEKDVAFLTREFPERFAFEECRNDFPYLYDRREQEKMTGKAFKHIRHTVNQCIGAHHWEVEAITGKSTARIREINRMWEKCGDTALSDLNAAGRAAENFDALSLWGLLFMADGQDAAYVMGSFVSPEIYDINFCKVILPDADYYVKWRLYRELPSEVIIVDSEEDMGKEGLRKHKLLRKPYALTPVWKGYLIHE